MRKQASIKVAHISSLIQEGSVIAVILKRDSRWDPLLVIQVGKVMEQLYKIMLVDDGLVFFKNNISTRCFCTRESMEWPLLHYGLTSSRNRIDPLLCQ